MSVVLPVHNGERFFEESTRSIMDQSLESWELILIDDGSTDATWRLATELAVTDPRVRLHRNGINCGLIKTLNAGFAMARGKYLARQDVDDISLATRLEKQADFLEEHPEVGLLGSAYVRIHRSGERSRRTPPLEDTHIRWRMLFGNVWCHTSMMIRRSLFEDGGPYYRQFLHAEDYELWLRLLKRTRAATIDEPLVYLREHDDSICAEHAEAQAELVDRMASGQLAELVQGEALDRQTLDRLRRCVRAQHIDRQEIEQARLVAELFSAFARQSEVSAAAVAQLRRTWTVRLVAACPTRLWPLLGSSGVLRSRDFPPAWTSLLIQVPWLKLRRFLQRP